MLTRSDAICKVICTKNVFLSLCYYTMRSLVIGIIIAIVLILTFTVVGAVVIKNKSDDPANNKLNGDVTDGSNNKLNGDVTDGSNNGSNGSNGSNGTNNGSNNGSNGTIDGSNGSNNGSNGSNNIDDVFECEYSDWSDWSNCSTGGCRDDPADPSGITFRTREVINGSNCTDVTETVDCNTEMCPRNCTYTNWGPWSRCDKECGDGSQTRTRNIDTPALYGGDCDDDVIASRPCIITPCPSDCTVSEWSDWSPCDEPCGDGNQFRTRTVNTPALYGGDECPVLREDTTCKVKECPIDCVVDNWSEWSDCDVDCGSGQQSRTRNIVVQPNADGVACPHVTEYKNCVMPDCPIDCVMSEWSEWSDCDVDCGDGTQTRTRTVLSQPQNGGAACSDVVSETRACYQPPCPIDCTKQMGEWSACNGCTGNSTRSEVMLAPALYGGSCDLATETKKCNADCNWSTLSTNRMVSAYDQRVGQERTTSLNVCKNKCLNTAGCDLVDFRTSGQYRTYNCLLYKQPKGTSYRDGVTLYKLS